MTGNTSTVVTKSIVALSALYAASFAVWMWVWPQAFSDYVGFPNHEHFLHDLGAFHFGIAVGLATSLIWRDSILVVLAGFAAANLVHTLNHAMDLHLGGATKDPYLIGGLTLIVSIGVVLRWRQVARVNTEQR